MKVFIESGNFTGTAHLQFGKYGDGSTAIQGMSPTGEPLFKATVALENNRPAEGCVFLKGWSENEGIPEALVKAGVVELTGRKAKTGFCEAIEAKLLIDVE